jgi:hypothetical protein
MSKEFFTQVLSEDTTEATVIRIGYCTAPVRLHIKTGFVVKKDDGRLYRLPGPFPSHLPPEPRRVFPEIDPFSPESLKARGYEIDYGSKASDHIKVNVGLKTWMRLPLAIATGLVTATE